MAEKFIPINDLTLAYREANSDKKKVILFIHGNSGSSRMWQKQFVSDTLDNYRLIAVDLPGHGKSSTSKRPEEDYSPIGTAKILSYVLNKLAPDEPFVLVGFSYGTNLIAEMLPHHINPAGLVLLGPCVLGENYGIEKVFVPRPTPSIFLYNEPNRNAVENFLNDSIDPKNRQDLLNSIEDYLNVDPLFKPTIFQTATEGKITDEIKNLYELDKEVCLMFGAKDNLINIDYLDTQPFRIWKNKICKIEGAGHWANIDKAEIFNKVLIEYTKEMLEANHV
ncbi:MAG TPA: alpha/beta hydrolase [Chitinophagaceae bacterium]|nr:alpha/beta hydrolase [Chitinophagaceae bacterium]